MSNKPFQFKEFIIQQDKCAMKVGTDGVLLGAWSSLEKKPNSILDIGAGTGLLALMMAQRSDAEIIDAIEIDDAAYEQCVDNFEASLWSDRLFCYHAGFDEFVAETDDTYDLILSNPPFYTEDYTTKNEQRDKARFNFSLPFDTLVSGIAKLLSLDGTFNVVIPYKEENNFLEIAKRNNLFPLKITHVKGNPTSEIKRTLLELSFTSIPCIFSELIIETERHQYTSEYIALTKNFYFKI